MAIDEEYLHRPFDQWPLILCGPIVRRVTRDSAAVFIAAKQSFRGTLIVYDRTGEPRQALASQGGGGEESLALGRNLHLAVLEATGLQLSPGQVYGYDLSLEVGGTSHDLGSQLLLEGTVPLGYEEGLLPGFVLPGSLDRLRIAHGSCRKPHGCDHATLSDPDILPMIDRLIELDRNDPDTRLQQLLLTGDQVYSDDVPESLLAALTSAGRQLLDWDRPEVFPDRRGIDTYTDDHVGLDPGDRSDFLDDQGVKDKPPYADPAEWSDYAANHLLFLTEWCAMYVFAWSPELWQLRDVVDLDDRDAHPTRSYYYLDDAGDTTPPALVYAQGLPWVRRALANVATYMVFDDHDVTDDWFLNQKVDEQLRGRGDPPNAGGRRLMRNALAAYAVFQHWGNDPEAFRDGTPGGDLLALLDAASGNPTIALAGHEEDANELLDVGPTALGVDRQSDRMRWDYELVFDEHRLIALDTRTWRGYPQAPRQVDPAEWLAAIADRVEELGDWGSAMLRQMGASWSDAADIAEGQLRMFLASSIVMLGLAADLADDLAGDVQGWEVLAGELLDEALVYLQGVTDSALVSSQAWAAAALDQASIGLAEADLQTGRPAVEGAMAMGAALGETAFRLRDATDTWLRETGLAAVDDAGLAAQRVLYEVADLCAQLAAYLEGSSVSVGRATRFGAAFARTWLTLAGDEAAVMWENLTGDTATAIGDAVTASADLLGTLEDLHRDHKDLIDPVWSLLVGDGSKKLNAELISDAAMDFQVRDRVAASNDERELTLVVSPSPVMGHWLAEFGQRAQVLKEEATIGSGDETWDNEPWSGNVPAFTRFLDAWTELGSVVFLSGDVHYAFSSVTDYVGRVGDSARFVQLTSSATKNADDQTRMLAEFDEVTDDLASMAMGQFDFVELLPTAEEWAQLPSDVADLVPSIDDVQAAVAARAAAIAETTQDQVQAGDEWLHGGWLLPQIYEALERDARDAFHDVKISFLQKVESELKTITDMWEDPAKALVGDRLQSHPLLQEQVLLLLNSVGVDVEELPELHTTVLRDLRADERAGDSPGLAARLDELFAITRNVRVRMDRVTVGHNNMGVISTQRTPLGRYLTHDLHWYPFDATVDEIPLSPDDDGSWRDDWIITRHVAGLTATMPPDGGAIGVPPPADVVIDALDIDITSPDQVQQGQLRVHPIDASGPTMPALTVSVRVPGLTDAEQRAVTLRVRLTCSYLNDARTDVTWVPGPSEAGWVTLPVGHTTWQPVFDQACGGVLEAFAEVVGGTSPVDARTGSLAHVVWGINPPKPDIHTAIGPAVNRQVVLHRESRFNQFADSGADIGSSVQGPHTVLKSFDHGYGLGQLTKPVPTSVHLWDWRSNVADSVARLDAFRQDALVYVEQVRQGLAWDAATDNGKTPRPPNEGIAHPEAPDFTTDQLDQEMWARYNSGRRFHDYDPGSQTWRQQPSNSAGIITYAPELLAMRNRVEAGNHPRGWFT